MTQVRQYAEHQMKIGYGARGTLIHNWAWPDLGCGRILQNNGLDGLQRSMREHKQCGLTLTIHYYTERSQPRQPSQGVDPDWIDSDGRVRWAGISYEMEEADPPDPAAAPSQLFSVEVGQRYHGSMVGHRTAGVEIRAATAAEANEIVRQAIRTGYPALRIDWDPGTNPDLSDCHDEYYEDIEVDGDATRQVD